MHACVHTRAHTHTHAYMQMLPVVFLTRVRTVLYKVFFFCFHSFGFLITFPGAPESVLETLTDATHEYYQQFMNHLRYAADSASMHGQAGFPVRVFKMLIFSFVLST